MQRAISRIFAGPVALSAYIVTAAILNFNNVATFTDKARNPMRKVAFAITLFTVSTLTDFWIECVCCDDFGFSHLFSPLLIVSAIVSRYSSKSPYQCERFTILIQRSRSCCTPLSKLSTDAVRMRFSSDSHTSEALTGFGGLWQLKLCEFSNPQYKQIIV
jgi:hypothetical protein